MLGPSSPFLVRIAAEFAHLVPSSFPPQSFESGGGRALRKRTAASQELLQRDFRSGAFELRAGISLLPVISSVTPLQIVV